MGLFDFLLGKSKPQEPSQASSHKRVSPPASPAISPYINAKALANCLFAFPYLDPSTVPVSVSQDEPLMEIIVAAYRTTIGPGGKTQQTTIDAAERIRLQAEFKTRIYALLDKCLAEDPEHAPAMLLYPKVAEWNTRAADRAALIALSERLLPRVDQVRPGSRGYGLIEQDIKGMGGNYFEKVERHLADFHFELGELCRKDGRFPDAIGQYLRAGTLMPPIYAWRVATAYAEIGEYEKALEYLKNAMKVRMKKFDKDRLKEEYDHIVAQKEADAEDQKAEAEELKKLLEAAGKLIGLIDQSAGILQKELYDKIPGENKRSITSMLRDFKDNGLISKKKKAGSYLITLQKPAVDALASLKDIYAQ